MSEHFQFSVIYSLMVIPVGTEEQLVLKTTDGHIHALNDNAHKFAFDIIFIGLKTKLDEVPTMEVSIL